MIRKYNFGFYLLCQIFGIFLAFKIKSYPILINMDKVKIINIFKVLKYRKHLIIITFYSIYLVYYEFFIYHIIDLLP